MPAVRLERRDVSTIRSRRPDPGVRPCALAPSETSCRSASNSHRERLVSD